MGIYLYPDDYACMQCSYLISCPFIVPSDESVKQRDTSYCYVVIGKAPAHFFNCSSRWPRLVGHFLLLSPGTDEAFFFKCGHVPDNKFKDWTCILHYQLPYMETHMLLCKYTKQCLIFRGF